MNRFTILIFLIFLLSALQLNAQRFKAYLAFGSNLTEADLTELGNSQVGTRLGLNMGPGISIILNKRWEPSMELLYSQNGYYTNLDQLSRVPLNKLMLHYLEVPLRLAYRFNIKKNEKESFLKRSISGGITYARLFKHKITGLDGTNLTNEVRFEQENALLFNFGATSFISNSFALNGKGTLSTFGEWTIALRLLYYI